eukprot:GHUV01002725.1.p1 GENE.GHUV01002725.1~~GHUV01002725.1.p1  ORF type:complete len:425 (+),score=78.38 GHUV01002725.1:1919-3193(+)
MYADAQEPVGGCNNDDKQSPDGQGSDAIVAGPEQSNPMVKALLQRGICFTEDGRIDTEMMDQKSKSAKAIIPPSPRLTVMRTLVELMHRYSSEAPGGKYVKSITVTGHSLGGALASLCGWDIAATLDKALEESPTTIPWLYEKWMNIAAWVVVKLGLDGNALLYGLTEQQRNVLITYIKEQRSRKGELEVESQFSLPAVGVVTFGAPRVGNESYARCFKTRSLINPFHVAEPVCDRSYDPNEWFAIGALTRDYFWALLEWPWYKVGEWQIWKDTAEQALLPAPKVPRVQACMLRVVNAHDLTPRMPPVALPVPRWFWYAHGGHELRLNSYFIPYFKRNAWVGASLGARHNLEMHLHMLDPNRLMALVNKTDEVLDPRQEILDSWWSPLVHKGTHLGKPPARNAEPSREPKAQHIVAGNGDGSEQ